MPLSFSFSVALVVVVWNSFLFYYYYYYYQTAKQNGRVFGWCHISSARPCRKPANSWYVIISSIIQAPFHQNSAQYQWARKETTKNPWFAKRRNGRINRVFANGPRDRGSIQVRVILKTQKMVLDAALLNTRHYNVSITGKEKQSRKGVAPSPTLWCSSYWKGGIRITLD